MTTANWDWVDKQEQENKEKSGDYFNIEEGENKFILLSHFAPLSQVWDGAKYRPAEEGDTNVSIKGVCWVVQKEKDIDNNEQWVIKLAKMPYTIVKSVRGISQDSDWDFEIPFKHPLNLVAKGAGTKEVKYTLTPSPKKVEIPQSVLDELAKKDSPEDIVEKIKGTVSPTTDSKAGYPADEITADDIPF